MFPPIGGQSAPSGVAEAAKEALQKQIDAKKSHESQGEEKSSPAPESTPAPAVHTDDPAAEGRAKLTQSLLDELEAAANPKMLATVAVKIVKAKGAGELDVQQANDLMKAHGEKVQFLNPKSNGGGK